ncbi:MAG: hypothetical protein AAGC72_10870 [Planctomycetota bacterium]
MPAKREPSQHKKKPLPILARHAVSLSIAFVLGLVLSFFIGQAIYEQAQLNKLNSPDQAAFERGVAYVLTHAGGSDAVTQEALNAVQTIDPQRAADLLLAVAQSHADRDTDAEPAIPDEVVEAIGPLMQRMTSEQAIGLYDGLVKMKGIDAVKAANQLLAALDPEGDAELLQVVDLLDTRLLWSRRWVPIDLWVRWLVVLAGSESELTQFNTAKRLGGLPEAVENARVVGALALLAKSPHGTVRNRVLNVCAGYAAIAEDPTSYEQIIFELGGDPNTTIARRAWMIVGHLNPLSGFAVNWKDADPVVAEAMLWAAVKTNPGNDKPALAAMQTAGYEAAGALALNEWRRPFAVVTDADLVIQRHLEPGSNQAIATKVRSILVSKDFMNLEATVIEDYGYEPIKDESLAALYLAGYWIRVGVADGFDQDAPFAELLLAASLEGVFEHQGIGSNPADAKRMLVAEAGWPPFARLLAAAHGIKDIDLDQLIAELPLDEPALLDLFTLALTHADNKVIDRFIRSSHPEMLTMAMLASVIKGYEPQLIQGGNADFIRRHPELTSEQLWAMSDAELAGLGLSRIDALPVLYEAANAAPPSAKRAVEAKLLQLALWVRGDLGDDFTPIAEAMLLDEQLPTSTVLMYLLHMQRPAAFDYLFGDLTAERPDLSELFIQQRYWHVFRRFVGTSDLQLWLWGDPAAQAFQLEAMRQWYAVNRWKIERGWWPEKSTTDAP